VTRLSLYGLFVIWFVLVLKSVASPSGSGSNLYVFNRCGPTFAKTTQLTVPLKVLVCIEYVYVAPHIQDR